ncbi:MAG TPA: hypothetical protein VK797_05340 [Tepidisphaeraceae bacterium]|jgi:hypothetical protein|nr:hypothetical protein [Tepidisphaeraceae bacterium]
MSEPRAILSPAGEQKRRAILDLALAAADRRRRGRFLARAGGALAVIACLLAIPLMLLHGPPPPRVAKIVPPPSQSKSDSLSSVTLIPTDPTIITRLALRPQPSKVVIIHDDELLAGLAQAHEPAGLAYVNGKAMLLFREQPAR